MCVDRGPGEEAEGIFENFIGQKIFCSGTQAGVIHLANSCWAHWPSLAGGHKVET